MVAVIQAMINLFISMVMEVVVAFTTDPVLFLILALSVFNGIMGLVFMMLGVDNEV